MNEWRFMVFSGLLKRPWFDPGHGMGGSGKGQDRSVIVQLDGVHLIGEYPHHARKMGSLSAFR
jgi:hypothetical protein